MIENANTNSWTVEQLVAFFDQQGIPKNAYSIYIDQAESYCLAREGQEWLVYYSEKGHRNHLGWGKTESQALDVLKLFVLEACRKL
jgi:hypothetical protein